MENLLESFYEGFAILIFCIGLELLFSCFDAMDRQVSQVKANIYEQHMLYGAEIDWE